jgi:hypothetical protein
MRSIFLKCLSIVLIGSAFSFNLIKEGKVQYKITIEKMFLEEDKNRVKERLQESCPGLEIEDVDYSAKTLIITTNKETRYDDIKQGFDKAGLRIMKEELLKEYKK